MTTQDSMDLAKLNSFAATSHKHPIDLESDFRVNFERYLNVAVDKKGILGNVEENTGTSEPFEVEIGRKISENNNYNEADLLIRSIEFERVDIYGDAYTTFNTKMWNIYNNLSKPKGSIQTIVMKNISKFSTMRTFLNVLVNNTFYLPSNNTKKIYKNERKVNTGRYLQYLVLFVDKWGRDHGQRMLYLVNRNPDHIGAGITFPWCGGPLAFRFHDGLAKWWSVPSDPVAFWRVKDQPWAKGSDGKYLFNYRYPGNFFIGKRLSYLVPARGGVKIP